MNLVINKKVGPLMRTFKDMKSGKCTPLHTIGSSK